MVRSLKYMVLLLLVPVCSSVAEAQIGVSIHDTSGVGGSKLNIPIYVDSSLSGLGVTSYQLQINYDYNYLAVDSIVTAGSMSESWGMVSYNKSKPGVLTIAAAGDTPFSGTGILLFIRFTLVHHTWGGYTTVSFSGGMFNEGSPTAVFSNGNISVSAPPSISISPTSGLLTVGDQLQFYVYGGVSPYQWSLTDNTVASIDADGLLTATHGGYTKVIAKDTEGTIDTTDGVVEIRSFRLSFPDTSYIQGQVFDMPIYTTDLTGLNATSGSFIVQFNQNLLTPLDVIKTGTIVTTYTVEFNGSVPGQVNISFAGSTPLSGSGVLLYIRFKISANNTGGSTISPINVLLNETMPGNAVNGYFQTINLTGLNISPNSATLISGDTLRFSVTGGTSPYSWSTSDNAVATINSEGLLTALKGGIITIQAQDIYGATATTGNIDVYDTRITLPDTVGPLGGYVEVPLYISRVQPGTHISSMQATIAYDTSIMKAEEIVNTGTLTNGWMYVSNITGTRITFAAGSSSDLSGPGVICKIRFAMSVSVPVGWRSALNIQQFLLNEGNPRSISTDGGVTVTPPAPPILLSPINEATGVSTNPSLTWSGSTVARTYRIQVSTDPTFASILIDSSGMTTTSLNLTGLPYLTEYFWRVNVTISELTSDWSSIWNFTVTSPPRISIYPTMVNFGKVVIGTRRDTLITLKNIGGDTLFITSVTSNNSLFVLKNISSLIVPGDSISDTLSYAPLSVVTDSAIIVVISNSVSISDTFIAKGTGEVGVGIASPKELPKVYALRTNYPNPFNPSTVIQYEIPATSLVTIKIYSIIGQEVATIYSGNQAPGTYTFTFDGSKLTSGVYFYRLTAGSFIQTKRMLLVK